VTAGDEALVRADIRDHARNPPAVVSRREGWVDSTALGSIIERHHIHLRHHGIGSDTWTQRADGHEFAPFWAPLIPRPEVCVAQNSWMEVAYAQLVSRM
jgi:hypothetical protein